MRRLRHLPPHHIGLCERDLSVLVVKTTRTRSGSASPRAGWRRPNVYGSPPFAWAFGSAKSVMGWDKSITLVDVYTPAAFGAVTIDTTVRASTDNDTRCQLYGLIQGQPRSTA